MALFARRENPPAQSNYAGYKPFLRRDFLARCAYCERTGEYLGGDEAFEVEHFKPMSKFADLVCAYPNLYYVCRKCNGHKWETWPTEDQMARGQAFADPCVEDPYVHHFCERENGDLDGLTECGNYTRGHIRLGRPDLRRWRVGRSQAQRDLPLLASVARYLEQLVSATTGPDREAAAAQLAAIRRRIEDSRLRYAVE